MRIVFHAEASPEMGSGHVMRISVLAEEAISRGISTVFVGHIHGLDWVNQRILNLGFDSISKDFNDLEINPSADVLLLDSYTLEVNSPYIQMCKWLGVISISDKVTPSFNANLRLIPSLTERDSLVDGVVTLSGAKYILTRSTITKKRAGFASSTGNKVLVVGGGSDPFGFCKMMAEILDSVTYPLEVHFFTGEIFQSKGTHNFVLHAFGQELDDIANDFDFVLTTASTSSFEFIAREIPTAVVCVVDNQREYYDQLGVLGLAVQIGLRNKDQTWDIDIAVLNEFLQDGDLKERLRHRMFNFIDLKGAARVLDQIIETYYPRMA